MNTTCSTYRLHGSESAALHVRGATGEAVNPFE